MWQLFTIVVLLGLMIGLEQVNLVPMEQYLGEAPPFTPKSLAATGFIVLAAFTTGQLFQRFKIPALLGYIAAGILFGPQFIQIAYEGLLHFFPETAAALFHGHPPRALFSSQVIKDLELINILTVGVIGTMGGGELKISDIKESWKLIGLTITLIIVSAIPLSIAVVMGITYLPFDLAPFLDGVSTSSKIACALLFGILAVAMSPAATLAIIQETRAKGKFTSLTLGIVVVADLALVALFLVGINVSKLLVAPEGFSFVKLAEALPGIGMEFAWALVVGTVTGLIFIAYMRYVRQEMMLFTVAIIFATSYVCKILHAETLLAFLTAGFIVQNFSRHGHDLIHELEKLSTPVFIVYFMTQAALLDIKGVIAYLPLTLILAAVRGASFYGSVKVATKRMQSDDVTQRWLWISFFSRGGVDLVLAAMVASAMTAGSATFAWGTDFQTVVMATVVVHIIVGPPLLKIALGGAGETEDARTNQESGAAAEGSGGLTPVLEEVEFPTPRFPDPYLNQRLEEMREHLIGLHASLIAQPLDERRKRLEESISQLRSDIDDSILKLQGILESDRYEDLDALKRAIKTLHMQSRRKLQTHIQLWEKLDPLVFQASSAEALILEVQRFESFENQYVVEIEPQLYDPEGANRRWIRLLRKLRGLQRATTDTLRRNIPLGRLWRYYIELSIPRYLARAAVETGEPHETFWFELGRYLRRFDTIFEELLKILDTPAVAPPELEIVTPEEATEATEGEVATAAEDGDAEGEESLDETSDGEASAEDAESSGEDTSEEADGDEPVGDSEVDSEDEESEEATAKEAGHEDDHGHDAHGHDEHGHDDHGHDDHGHGDEEPADPYSLSGPLSELDPTAEPRERALAFLQSARELHKENASEVITCLGAWLIAATQGYSWSLQQAYAIFLDAVARAGTLELPSMAYRPSTQFDEARRAETQLAQRLEREANIVSAYVGWIVLDHQLALFSTWFGQYQKRIVDTVQTLFQDQCLRQYQRMEKLCEAGIEELEAPATQEGAGEGEAIELEEQRDWAEWYKRELEPITKSTRRTLDRALISFGQGVTSRRLIDALEYRVAGFSESLQLLLQDPHTASPSTANLETIELRVRQWFSNRLVSEIALRYIEFNERTERVVRRNIVGLDSISQVIEYNLISAHKDANELDDEASDAVARSEQLAVLRRGENLISQQAQSLAQDVKELQEWILKETSALEKSSTGPFLEHDISDLPRQLSRTSQARAIATKQGLSARVAPLLGWIKSAYASLTPLYEELLEDVRHILSETPRGEHRARIRERLELETPATVKQLPPIYKRLFNPVPLDLPEFYVERPEVEARCLDAISQWGRNQPVSILLVGDRGIGKRTFIHNLVPIKIYDLAPVFQQLPIQTVRLGEDIETEEQMCEQFRMLFKDDRPSSFAEMTRALRGSSERQIVIVENANKCYQRTSDGMALCRDFLQMINDTNGKVLWLLLMDSPAATLLDTMIDLFDYFSHIFDLKPLDEEQLEAMILNRHRVSGFELDYEAPNIRLLYRTRHPLAASEALRNPHRDYFKRLHGLSRGNPLLALLYWLRSIHPDMSSDTKLHVVPMDDEEVSLVNNLTLRKKLILALLLQHGSLTPEHLHQILDIPTEQIRIELEHLGRLGFIELIGGTTQYYRLRDIAATEVTFELQHANLV